MIEKLTTVKQRVITAGTHANLGSLGVNDLLVGIEEPASKDKNYALPLVLSASALERARDDLTNVIKYALSVSEAEKQSFVRYLPSIVQASTLLSSMSVHSVQDVGRSFNKAVDAGVSSGKKISSYTHLAGLNVEQSYLASRVQEGSKCGSRGNSSHRHSVDKTKAAILLPKGVSLSSSGSVANTSLEADIHDAMQGVVGSLLYVSAKKFEDVCKTLNDFSRDIRGKHPTAARHCDSASRLLQAVYQSSGVLYSTVPPKPLKLK